MRQFALGVLVGLATAALTFVVDHAPAHRLGPSHTVRATAYCYGQVTSSGRPAKWGMIAAGYGTDFYGHRLYVIHGLVSPANGHRRWWFYAGDRDPSGPMDVFLEGVSEPLCGGIYPRRVTYRVALS